MANIAKEIYENNDIGVITDNLNRLWLNEKHIEEQLGHKFIINYKQIRQNIQKTQM